MRGCDRLYEQEPETENLPHVRPTMLLPIVVLLAGSLALGVVPQVVRGVSRAAVEFVDKHGYVSAALQGTTARLPEALPEAEWTTKGVLLGLLTVLLAAAVAAAALWAPKIPDLAKSALAPLRPVVTGLHRVHSGHIGDYIAWLFVGVAAFTALVGVPLI